MRRRQQQRRRRRRSPLPQHEESDPEELEEPEEKHEELSPEEAERLHERKRMELQLAHKIRQKLRKDQAGRKVKTMPLIRMLVRVARGVFPERRMISVDKFQRILGKDSYGGLSKPMSRWLALFLGSDGVDVCLEHLIDFLKSSPPSYASELPSDTPSKMKRFASSYLIDEKDSSPRPNRVPSHLTTWQITVLMAIRDAIRANRRVFSKNLRSETSSVRDMFRHAFQTFDLDGDGRIDVSEFRTVLERLDIRLSSKQIHSFLKTLDRNGDGKINCEEFLNTLEMQLDRLPPTKSRLSPKRRGTFWGTYESNDVETSTSTTTASTATTSIFNNKNHNNVKEEEKVEKVALIRVQETYDNVLESLGQHLKDMVLQEEKLKREIMSSSNGVEESSRATSKRRSSPKKNRVFINKRSTTSIDQARLLRLADINKRRFRYMFSTALCNDQEDTTTTALRAVEKIESHITNKIIEDLAKELNGIVDGVVHDISGSL